MNTARVSSFVLISIPRGQPRTPPSGDKLGVLDYHLKALVGVTMDVVVAGGAGVVGLLVGVIMDVVVAGGA